MQNSKNDRNFKEGGPDPGHLISMAWVCDARKVTQEQLQNTLRMLIVARTGNAENLENVDWFTLNHARLLMGYSEIILNALHLNNEWALRVGVGVHDVGKMTIPTRIWMKNGSLTGIERRYAQQHVENGYRLLKKYHAGEDIAQIALLHHERMDGHGYPNGLNRHEIPMAAKVAAVIDVFDALISPRRYKTAWGTRAVADYLEIHRDGRFDANVVDAVVDHMGTLLELRARRANLG